MFRCKKNPVKQITTLGNGRYHILSIEALTFLPDEAQKTWQLIATTSSPALYEQQLRENIGQTRRHGDNGERASRRSEIIEQLNRLAIQKAGQSFNDLCQITGTQSSQR